MPILRRRDLVCQEAIELLTEYLEGALSRRQRRRLRTHLEACPNCSAYLEQIRVTIRLSGSIEPEDLPPKRRTNSLSSTAAGWQGSNCPREIEPVACTGPLIACHPTRSARSNTTRHTDVGLAQASSSQSVAGA